MEERELIGLLYRADWTRLSLAGTVRGTDPADSIGLIIHGPPASSSRRADGRFPPSDDYSPADFDGEVSVAVGPGGRYRQATASGSRIRGCDGERTWEWLGDLPPGVRVAVSGKPRPPVAELLAPSWLLAGHRLSVEDGAVACGRYGIRVVAEPAWGDRLPGLHASLPAMTANAPWPGGYERAVVIVDAELGILLRCAREAGDDVLVTEFTHLTVGAAPAPEEFTAPPGSAFGGRPESAGADFARAVTGPAGAFGWEVAKTAGGLAAGGLGALVRLAPARRKDPFTQAASAGDDPEGSMPATDPLPSSVLALARGDAAAADLPEVSDDVLCLLHRGGAVPVPFTGTLHEWTDYAGLLAAVPESARRAGLGGVGFLVDSLLARKDGGDAVKHLVHEVRFGGPSRYRVDVVTGHDKERGLLPRIVACDGERYWEVYADRVETGRAGKIPRLPDGVAMMTDGSWLLGCRLFGGSPAEVAGRRGYQVVAVRGAGAAGFWSTLGGDWLPAVAVVDAETGLLLRLTRYLGGQAGRVLEFRSLAPEPGTAGAGETGGFEFVPPPGLRVVEQPEPSVRSEGDMAYDEEFDGYLHRHETGWDAGEAFRRRADGAARRFFGPFFGGGESG